MAEIKLTKENFEQEVTKSDIPVLADFWATWCGPCRMLSPVISDMAEKYAGKIKVGKVNTDEEEELAAAFRISAIPTVILFKDGKAVDSFMGYRPAAEVEEFIKKAL